MIMTNSLKRKINDEVNSLEPPNVEKLKLAFAHVYDEYKKYKKMHENETWNTFLEITKYFNE